MDLKTDNIFVTGGAGSLGRAIARKRQEEGWKGKFTVYSRDTFKHERMRKLYPDVTFIQGDILNPELLYNAMVGHDYCLHLGAAKVIPTSEYQSIDTFDVNVSGSLNVCIQAMRAGMKHVLGISTDKVCYPVNAYGASKLMMEKVFQEYARIPSDTQFHLVRYGNCLESTGSVIEAWKDAVENGKSVKMTDPTMTRFFLSPAQAAGYAIRALGYASGLIFVPRMPSLSIGKLAEYALPKEFGNVEIERIPLRPGEKMHESLITAEEGNRVDLREDYYLLFPSTVSNFSASGAYSSDIARELTHEELTALLND